MPPGSLGVPTLAPRITILDIAATTTRNPVARSCTRQHGNSANVCGQGNARMARHDARHFMQQTCLLSSLMSNPAAQFYTTY